MGNQALLLGIDVGTTGSKAVLVGADGQVIAEAANEYPMSVPRPLWAEQDPQDWWSATVASIRQVLAQAGVTSNRIAGVGLTGQMHGLVLLDQAGHVLRPCIMWNDQRTALQCEAITRQVGPQRVLELVGNPILPGFTASKLLWVREHEPQIYRKIAQILLPKDYVRYRLTGAFCTDVSDASGTCLFDVGRRCWSEKMLDALAIPRSWLPEPAESPAATASVSGEAATQTGLLSGTPVVAGAGDQAAQAVGTGVVGPGVISVTLGTSGVVFAAADRYQPQPAGRLHTFCHAVPGKWHWMGVMLSAGGSFRWLRDALGQPERAQALATGQDPYDLLACQAQTVAPGCEGLIFLPYLTGERTPYPDPSARGVFFGLTVRHTKGHLIRAVLEGVSYGLRDSLELLRELGVEIRQVRATGGGARSPVWLQILADVFGVEIVTVNVTQGAAYGAALLAAVGVGIFPDVPTACARTVRQTGRFEPGPGAKVYARFYPQYRALYPALKEQFKSLAEAQERASP
jgi:xylulokinase